MRRITVLLFVGASYLSFAQANIQLLDQYFDSLEKYNKGMGGIAIYEQGKIRYTTDMGYSSMSPKVANSKKTKYRIGSISKTFTAVMIMQMVEEGKVKLKTPLSAFFPDLPKANEITIEHLLRHRSGLYNFTDSEEYMSYMAQEFSREKHFALFQKNGTIFPVDSTFSYSNSGYVILGYILEELDQKTYADILETRIVKPLKLKSTYHATKYDLTKNEALSYSYAGTWMSATQTNGTVALGAGSIVSHPKDLVHFFDALLTGQLVSNKSLEQMKTWKDDYGFGLFPIERDGYEGFGHTGGIDGFQSILFTLPEKGVVVAYCANGINMGRKEIVETALQFYFNEKSEPISFEQRVILLDEEILQQYVGSYFNAQSGMRISVKMRSGHLEAQAEGQSSFPLDALSKTTFVFDNAGIKMIFSEEDKNFTLNQNGIVLTFVRDSE